MRKGLTGKRIAIGGSRKIEEISLLIQKQGGTPVVRPLQGTVLLAEEEINPGIFGAKTEAVVRAYQKRHVLKVDGLVGKNTWNKMF